MGDEQRESDGGEGIAAAWGAARQAGRVFLGLVVADTELSEAAKLVVTQVVNDFECLLTECDAGNGRSAMRSARSLIEHAINLASILDSSNPQNADRFLRHFSLGGAILYEQRPGEELLDSSDRRSYAHELHKLRFERREFNKAKQEYGSAFGRSWAEGTLADRARQYDMADLYELYRLASQVTHGAAWGAFGLTRPARQLGWTIYRIGPALQLAPHALLIGARAFDRTMELVDSGAPLRRHLEPLMAIWPGFYAGMLAGDRGLWPENDGLPPRVVYAYTRRGRRSIYHHDAQTDLLWPASNVQGESPEMVASLKEVVERAVANPERYFGDNDHFVVWPIGVTAIPTGAASIPASAILPDAEGGEWTRVRFN